MSKPNYPYHLRSWMGIFVSACGNSNGVIVQWRSIKRVECKNCLKIIANGVETKYFRPRKVTSSS